MRGTNIFYAIKFASFVTYFNTRIVRHFFELFNQFRNFQFNLLKMPNMALNLTPFGRWTALKRRRLALR
jgi:hypothetical protein